MGTYTDLTAHILISFLVGFFVWYLYGKKTLNISLCLLAAFLSGVMIDIDHFFDYFMAFGFHFNLMSFLKVEQFAASGKNYVLFHGFEYVILIGILFVLVKNKKTKVFLLALGLSMFMHLLTDMTLFGIPARQYFILYRALHHFNINN